MKYEGELAKPIVRRKLTLVASDEDIEQAVRAQVAEMLAKLPALFSAFNVAQGDWVGLALSLAKEHVPGFKVVEPAGRRTEWSVLDRALLRLDVDEIAQQRSISTTEAIKLACRTEAWKTKTGKMSMEAIRKQYSLADSRWVAVARDARSLESMGRDN